jgi:hypothetical protein
MIPFANPIGSPALDHHKHLIEGVPGWKLFEVFALNLGNGFSLLTGLVAAA